MLIDDVNKIKNLLSYKFDNVTFYKNNFEKILPNYSGNFSDIDSIESIFFEDLKVDYSLLYEKINLIVSKISNVVFDLFENKLNDISMGYIKAKKKSGFVSDTLMELWLNNGLDFRFEKGENYLPLKFKIRNIDSFYFIKRNDDYELISNSMSILTHDSKVMYLKDDLPIEKITPLVLNNNFQVHYNISRLGKSKNGVTYFLNDNVKIIPAYFVFENSNLERLVALNTISYFTEPLFYKKLFDQGRDLSCNVDISDLNILNDVLLYNLFKEKYVDLECLLNDDVYKYNFMSLIKKDVTFLF